MRRNSAPFRSATVLAATQSFQSVGRTNLSVCNFQATALRGPALALDRRRPKFLGSIVIPGVNSIFSKSCGRLSGRSVTAKVVTADPRPSSLKERRKASRLEACSASDDVRAGWIILRQAQDVVRQAQDEVLAKAPPSSWTSGNPEAAFESHDLVYHIILFSTRECCKAPPPLAVALLPKRERRVGRRQARARPRHGPKCGGRPPSGGCVRASPFLLQRAIKAAS
jgi:hypothetical protein